MRYGSGKRRTVSLMLMALACGCTTLGEYVHNGFKVGPNYTRPPAPTSPAWIDSADPRVRSDVPAPGPWWTVFGDPLLDSLIQTAHDQNLDFKTAGTRVLDALAQRNISAGNLLPQSQTALGAYAHAQISRNFGLPFPNTFNIWATGFNASWELDYIGRLRRTIEAADANLNASIEDCHNVLVLLLAETASNYVRLRTLQQRLAYVRRNVEIQKQSLELAELRFDKGVATEIDVSQARANLAQTEALIPPLETGLRQANNQLCLLLGLPPHPLEVYQKSGPIPTAPAEVAVGIPADLLRRRPDVRQAERLMAAQAARIGIAEADLYPRLILFGFIGYTADTFAKLFDASSYTGLIAPIFQWNILNYGRLLNNIRANRARFQGQVFTYQQTVLRAAREAEDALVAFLRSQQQAQQLEKSVANYQRTVEVVMDQYRNGIADFNRVFTTEAALVQQQDQLAEVRGNIALNLIALYRALGGGWEVHFGKGATPPQHAPNFTAFSAEEKSPQPAEPIPAPRRLPPNPADAEAPPASEHSPPRPGRPLLIGTSKHTVMEEGSPAGEPPSRP
jgi:NodT family efflux transporter outer membrane factor (OMF) lipoprotein